MESEVPARSGPPEPRAGGHFYPCLCVRRALSTADLPMHLTHGLLKEISLAINSAGFGAKPEHLASPSAECLPEWEETRAVACL